MSGSRMTWMCGLMEKRLKDNITGAGQPAPMKMAQQVTLLEFQILT